MGTEISKSNTTLYDILELPDIGYYIFSEFVHRGEYSFLFVSKLFANLAKTHCLWFDDVGVYIPYVDCNLPHKLGIDISKFKPKCPYLQKYKYDKSELERKNNKQYRPDRITAMRRIKTYTPNDVSDDIDSDDSDCEYIKCGCDREICFACGEVISVCFNVCPCFTTKHGIKTFTRRLNIEKTIYEIPHNFSKIFNSIVELKCEYNELTWVPKLPKCMELLYMTNNKITDISNVYELSNLRVLDLSDNRIYNLDYSINNLSHLVDLNLSYNAIHVVPSFDNLSHIVDLNLSFNYINTLPSTIYNLPRIRYLNMEDNLLCDDIVDVKFHLNVCKNNIKRLRGNVDNVVFDENPIKQIADKSFSIIDEKIIDVGSGDKIVIDDKAIGSLRVNSETLFIARTHVENTTIKSKEIHVDNVRADKLHASNCERFTLLNSHIRELEISDSNVEFTVENSIVDNVVMSRCKYNAYDVVNIDSLLCETVSLSFTSCGFNVIPHCVYNMKKIKKLDLSDNNIKVVDRGVLGLKTLKEFIMMKNPIVDCSILYKMTWMYKVAVSCEKFYKLAYINGRYYPR